MRLRRGEKVPAEPSSPTGGWTHYGNSCWRPVTPHFDASGTRNSTQARTVLDGGAAPLDTGKARTPT